MDTSRSGEARIEWWAVALVVFTTLAIVALALQVFALTGW
jgi:hypothetical protein